MNAVLVDASAFVALLDRSDHHHHECVGAMASIDDPLITVWPVVTEAMYLVARLPSGQDSLFNLILDWLGNDGLSIADLDASDLRRMKQLVNKYRDLPMSFGDAALVALAERERLTRIVTFDEDFRVYSLPGRARFVLLGAGPSSRP